MVDNSPKLFFVSVFFVAIITVLTDLNYRLPGIEGAYIRYMEFISAGTPHSIRLLLSQLAPVGLALAALLLLMTVIIQVGFFSYCIKTKRSLNADIKDIFNGFLFLGKVLLILILSSILIALWTLLFFFPGVVAYYKYCQAYYIMLDDPNKSAIQCLRESKLLMKGNKLDLFLIDLSFIGWFFLSVLFTLLMLQFIPFPLPIVSIWLAPYLGLSRATYYSHLLDKLAV